MRVEIFGLLGIPEVKPHDDLPGLIVRAIRSAGLTLVDGDVLVVTQKVVSKAEGRVVPAEPDGKAAWVDRESRRVVARRGDLIIAETRHGFICANAGVDESNVAAGFLTLLPEDPDASAERIREAIAQMVGASVGVVVTDTFGRPWRRGLVNVAIGCAGFPALVDLRGGKDSVGRVLEVTIQALADEVAGAAGLVMGKAEGVPVAVVRGVRAEAPPTRAALMVRSPAEDLFRESPLQALVAVESIGVAEETIDGAEGAHVPREVLRKAVAAACLASARAGSRDTPLFVAAASRMARRRLSVGLTAASGSAALGRAAAVVVLCVQAPPLDRPALLISCGVALQTLRLSLRAHGIASTWMALGPNLEGLREALDLGEGWTPLAAIAAGLAASSPIPHAPVEMDRFFREIR